MTIKQLGTLAICAAISLSGCATENETSPEDAPIRADHEQSHEQLQNPDSGIITYGNPIPDDAEIFDVIVDGAPRKSIFTQKNLDFAGKESITREEYEDAFLDMVACIEGRGGWIHYDIDAHIIDYTYTSSSDPNAVCETGYFYFATLLWQETHFSDESEQILFYVNCLKDNGLEPVHTAPHSEFGPPQWDQNRDLQLQAKEAGVDCGSFIESFYDNAPYPE